MNTTNNTQPWRQIEEGALKQSSRHDLRTRVMNALTEITEEGPSVDRDLRLENACNRLEREFPSGLSVPGSTPATVKALLQESNANDRLWDIYVDWYVMKAQKLDVERTRPAVVHLTGREITPHAVTGSDRLPGVDGIGAGAYYPLEKQEGCFFGKDTREAEAWLLQNGYRFVKQSPEGEQLWTNLPPGT